MKAIFLDYTGTMVREDDPYTTKLLKTVVMNCDVKDPNVVFSSVWKMIKEIEYSYYKDTFILKDEMVDMILNRCVTEFGLHYDLDELHSIWRDSWIHAPLFDDVKPFFERCSLPIYVVTNDDIQYVEQSMKEKELKPAGIISAEMVKACKPHREILDEGLKMLGLQPDEVVLIGDSETSDVACAREVGIKPILLDRFHKSNRRDIKVVHSLDELNF